LKPAGTLQTVYKPMALDIVNLLMPIHLCLATRLRVGADVLLCIAGIQPDHRDKRWAGASMPNHLEALI
jgi:hypothetical protein